MGLFGGFFRKLSGESGAKRAARDQVAAGDRAIDTLRDELGLARESITPFRDVGTQGIDQLNEFGPDAQRQFADERLGRAREIGQRSNPFTDQLLEASQPGQSVQDIDALRNFDSVSAVMDNPLFTSAR